ncbi:MAG: hypothetical protein INR73_25055 [Williamsia sp.]|nr:hypothetical protein [Williamsia sp.]
MGIEPEVRDFLKRIMFSIGAGLAWLFINITAGIFGGWFFFHDSPTKGNWVFYAWFLLSLGLLLRIYYRLWSKHI